MLIPTLVAVWFLFTAKSVRLTFEPEPWNPCQRQRRGCQLRARRHLPAAQRATTGCSATAPGYFDLDAALAVGDDRNQLHHFQLSKLPGRVTFETQPAGAEVAIDGVISATTPTDLPWRCPPAAAR